MKVYLMYRDRDVDPEAALPAQEADLVQDLELGTLLRAMARDDRFILNVASRALLIGTSDLDTLRYRQDILRDCIAHPDLFRALYQVAVDAEATKKRGWMGIYSRYPTGVLTGAVNRMHVFTGLLKRLRRLADDHVRDVASEGLRAFFALLQIELDDAYFASIESRLSELTFKGGILLSARLGRGNEGEDYVLRQPAETSRGWLADMLAHTDPGYTFSIHPRDDAGARALGDLRNTGVNLVANAVAQSSDHIDAYLKALRTELAFYIGCLNLHEDLAAYGASVCYPLPAPAEERLFTVRGLYDLSLALTMAQRISGNDVDGDGKHMTVITGANQGGKSAFLRSVGIAQLMMQCGMFVPAEAYTANVCRGLFTHFRREEDTTMKSGKLDEELGRMSGLVDHMVPHAMVLFNESFAATNEREGSEIATQIIDTLLEKQIKVFFVTHLYAFAHAYWRGARSDVLFLRAQRKEGGERTYRLEEGEPLQTSYGQDIYEMVFGKETESGSPAIPSRPA